MSKQTGDELTLKKMEEATDKKPSEEEAFSDRLNEMTRGAFVSGAVGLAKELGLFETMASYSEPKTVPVIAAAAGIKPRFVNINCHYIIFLICLVHDIIILNLIVLFLSYLKV